MSLSLEIFCDLKSTRNRKEAWEPLLRTPFDQTTTSCSRFDFKVLSCAAKTCTSGKTSFKYLEKNSEFQVRQKIIYLTGVNRAANQIQLQHDVTPKRKNKISICFWQSSIFMGVRRWNENKLKMYSSARGSVLGTPTMS